MEKNKLVQQDGMSMLVYETPTKWNSIDYYTILHLNDTHDLCCGSLINKGTNKPRES